MAEPLPPEFLRAIEQQEGVFTAADAASYGVSESQVRSHIKARRWRRLERGLYVAFTGPLPRMAQVRAAIALCGPDAAASHETAIELWGLTTAPIRLIHLAVPVGRRPRPRPGIVVHRTRRLARTVHPTADPPRIRVEPTLIDLAAAARSREDAIGWLMLGVQQRRTTAPRLRTELLLRPTARRRDLLLDVLADIRRGAQTPLELRFLRSVIHPHGLPEPRMQRHRYAGAASQWVDADFDPIRLLVELDGRLGHGGADGLFRDQRRDNVSTLSGAATLRFGWPAADEHRCATAIDVEHGLHLRGWTGFARACNSACPVPQQSVERFRRPDRGNRPTFGRGQGTAS